VPWRARLLARFRTIQACPKDRLTLPLAGCKMRQSVCEGGRFLVLRSPRGTVGGGDNIGSLVSKSHGIALIMLNSRISCIH
jgi:hypothetical protein